MRKLRRKKAHGIDELPPNLLKDAANEISKPLAFIINKSLSSGIVPDLWKISKVTPLYTKAYPVFRGVPQGSILGSTLFLLHLDDIDNCLRHSCIIKYADDTVIYVSGNDSDWIQKKLNTDILEVHNWLTDNDLSLNLKKSKSESMIFGT